MAPRIRSFNIGAVRLTVAKRRKIRGKPQLSTVKAPTSLLRGADEKVADLAIEGRADGGKS